MRFYALRLHEAGDDQVKPAKNYRARHRLAVFERAEEGIEDLAMKIWQVYRLGTFMLMVALSWPVEVLCHDTKDDQRLSKIGPAPGVHAD